MPRISDSKILIISDNGFEQSELFTPLEDLKAKGATVHVATPDGNAVKGWDQNDWGKSVEADLKISDVTIEDYDCLVIPGGQINPDLLRVNEDALKVVKGFVSHDKIVAAICHGPWLFAETGVAKGREMTSYHSIKTDLINAGAKWVDQEIAISNGIITSRSPEDLPAFVAKIVEEVEEGEHQRPAA